MGPYIGKKVVRVRSDKTAEELKVTGFDDDKEKVILQADDGTEYLADLEKVTDFVDEAAEKARRNEEAKAKIEPYLGKKVSRIKPDGSRENIVVEGYDEEKEQAVYKQTDGTSRRVALGDLLKAIEDAKQLDEILTKNEVKEKAEYYEPGRSVVVIEGDKVVDWKCTGLKPDGEGKNILIVISKGDKTRDVSVGQLERWRKKAVALLPL